MATSRHSLSLADVVDPVWAGNGCLVALRWDRRPCAHIRVVFAKGVIVVASVPDDPFGQAGRLVKQRNGMVQFMGLARCDPEGDGAALPVGDYTSLGSIGATQAAQSFTASRSAANSAF